MDLETSVGELPFVGNTYLMRLEKLGVKTLEDLLLHVPHRYEDFRASTKIKDVRVGETVTIKGELVSIKNIYTKSRKVMQEAIVKDDTGEISVTWFNQPYLVRSFAEGDSLSFSGKVGFWGRRVTLISPVFEKTAVTGGIHTGRLVPIYPETAGLSSKWLRRQVENAFKLTAGKWKEFLPEPTLKNLKLSRLSDSIKSIHFPKTPKEAEYARKRLAFNELLLLQMNTLYKKSVWEKTRLYRKFNIDKTLISKFISSLPFELTDAQKRVNGEILSDLAKDSPMNRLLEGDVGSGKTVLAAIAAFASFTSGFQTVLMAPTQILAQQHFNTLNTLLSPFKMRVRLVTSAGVKGDMGSTDIFVGTHALIHNKVHFNKVGLIVIDEQHRFGVEQRAHLAKKSGGKIRAPHVLTMTATPIPRTVALTAYGDLDLSTLDELPRGRVPIKTWVVPPQKRPSAYRWIGEQIKKSGVQAFVVCPLIEVSNKESLKQIKSAKTEFEKIKKEFPGLSVGLLHGKLSANEKDRAIKAFSKGKTDILVTTPVVEVGIDIPNATIMLIEGADRFGLAQLHQLRGRIGRGKKQSYCLLFSEKPSKKAQGRLSALTQSLSGFELAELDLKLRGPGEVFGTAQSGFPELKIAHWSDLALIKASRKVAEEAFSSPEKFKLLHEKAQKEGLIPN